jgi:arginase
MDQATAHERDRLERLALPRIAVEALRDDPAAAAAAALGLLPAAASRVAVHVDVDVVDFVDAPLSENTGRGTGVPLDAALDALAVVLRDPRMAALTVTEVNPLHGEEDGSSLDRLVAGLARALGDTSVHSRRGAGLRPGRTPLGGG